jgi:hypothetical protein
MVKYASLELGDRLRQGEVLAGLVRVRQSLMSIGADRVQVDEILHSFAIVLTQDCDLSQDAAARDVEKRASQDSSLLNDLELRKRHEQAPKQKLDNILLCEAQFTSEMKGLLPPGKDIWKRIVQNKDERYHCLEAVPPEHDSQAQGIPSLGCDFKRFFTVPADEVYSRLELGQLARRSRLVTPYAEHLLHRFCNFQARIPLPENHDVLM